MVRFNDMSIYTNQALECQYCRSCGDANVDGKMTLLDIILPEVFISYHHGYPKDPDNESEITPSIAQVSVSLSFPVLHGRGTGFDRLP
jgi:hypothetical protein